MQFDLNSLYENVLTWAEYNPYPAGAVRFILVAVATYAVLTLLRGTYRLLTRGRSEPTKQPEPEQDELAALVLPNGGKLSQKHPGRIVPRFGSRDNLSSAVSKVLDANDRPSIDEIIGLFDEGGFGESGTREHTRSRIYAVLPSLRVGRQNQ